MKMKKYFLLLVFILFNSLATYSQNKMLLLDIENLNAIKEKIIKKDKFVMPAYETLLTKADEALQVKSLTVTSKKILPKSGDKHDYMSFGPYWWPNPDTKDGLPYIQKDGQINPESKTESDSPKLSKLASTTEALALAYFYTDETKYAEHAGKLIKEWFINKETKMNPHLKYAQAIPGKVDGRGIGIIDSRHLVRILDAASLIEATPYFTKSDKKELQNWIKEFNNWLLNGEYSYEEYNWPNNHGTFYDYQTAAYSLYTSNDAQAKKIIKDAQYRRLASHIGSKGQNFHELERTRPLHYSIFDLEALVGLAVFSDNYSEINFWNFVANKAKLKNAIDYIITYKNNSDMWIVPKEKVKFDSFAEILLIANQKYKDSKYEEEIEKLWKINPNNLSYLKWNKK